MKNSKPTHPLVEEFYDLEEFGETLFATTPAAPKLSKKRKRAILASIIGPRLTFTKLGFGFAATAFAAFAILFGFAQTSNPSSPLYRLKVASDPAPQVPTIQQQETVKAEIQKQQTVVDALKKTGAPVKEVKAAEKTLNKSIESGKKLGIDVNKVIEDSRKSSSESSDKKSDSDSENKDTDLKDSQRNTSGSSSQSGSSGSSTTNR